MILYYAMGGGLGHLTRSLAILHEAPQLSRHVRLMVSSKHAPLVMSYAPCPVDVIAGERLTSKRKYLKFLDEYLKQYRIEVIVLDTFPFGIVGEWCHVGGTIPRLLVARYLKWKVYVEKTCKDGPIPWQTLVLEPLAKEYSRVLKRYSQLTVLDVPITLQPIESSKCRLSDRKDCLVVHSGNEAEREVLIGLAKQEFGDHHKSSFTPDCIFPEQGIYPAEQTIPHYANVVSAAGYNMTAIASQSPPERTHILFPFRRRFDNQSLRTKRLKNGLWQQQNNNGAQQAAQWLIDIIGNHRI
jgi:hypothetical protein